MQKVSTDVMAFFESKQMKCFAQNLQLCGFAIYDITQPEREVTIKLLYFEYDFTKGEVISLATTDYQSYLWVGYANGLIEIYDIKENNFPLIYSQKLDQNDILNKVIQFQVYFDIFRLQQQLQACQLGKQQSLNFKRTYYPNLNLDIPNFLLNQYQLISYTFYKPPKGNFDLQLIFEQPSNVLFMTRKDKGSAVFKYYGQSVMDLVSLLDYNVPSISTSYQARVPGTDIFYQSREVLGLQIVDILTQASLKYQRLT